MSEHNKGEVRWVGSKKVGSRVFWSFNIGEKDTFYRTGTIKPKFKKGDYIEFDYEDGKYGLEVDVDTIVVKESEASSGKSAEQAAKGASGAKRGGNSKDEYWQQKAEDDKARQDTISYQAALNSSINFVSKAVELNVLKVGGEQATKAKYKAFKEAVIKQAEEFYRDFLSAPELAAELRGQQSDSNKGKPDESMNDGQENGDNLDE